MTELDRLKENIEADYRQREVVAYAALAMLGPITTGELIRTLSFDWNTSHRLTGALRRLERAGLARIVGRERGRTGYPNNVWSIT